MLARFFLVCLIEYITNQSCIIRFAWFEFIFPQKVKKKKILYLCLKFVSP